jgi:hypothetical protein
MAACRKCNVGGDLNAILSLLKEENEDNVIIEKTDSDSISDESVSDSENSDTNDEDDENSDTLPGPCATLNLRNLKWVSKLDKPIGKCGFTRQPGINATVNYVNDSLELFELFVTDELVGLIVKETNRYAAQHFSNSFVEVLKTSEVEGYIFQRNRNLNCNNSDAGDHLEIGT